MTAPIATRDQAKAHAKWIRADVAKTGEELSHSAALERVAKDAGFADWNTLCANLPETLDPPLTIGDRVAGRYLGVAFNGSIVDAQHAVECATVQIAIAFDERSMW